MTNFNSAIVIATYSRPEALYRLLESIANANYNTYTDIPLIISIDGGGPTEMLETAEKFDWKYGVKQIINHPENLGLRKHIISCGDLTEKFGSIILLEDDLFVSPNFYNYANKALDFYDKNERIAGISLYTYSFNENAFLPFIPIKSSFDTYFKQVPSSCGQAWTYKHWKGFKDFYNSKPVISSKDKLPENVKNWAESSWKKYFYKYIVDFDLYFVFPYLAYSTNFGDIGTHFNETTTLFQIPIDTNSKNEREYLFPLNIKESITYDAYFELMPYCFNHKFNNKVDDFCVDLYGQKQLDLFENEYWLSIKDCKSPLEQFGIALLPIENNINCNIIGNKISYAKKEYFSKDISNKIKKGISENYSGVIFSNAYHSGEEIGYNLGWLAGRTSVYKSRIYKIGYYISYPLNFILSKEKRFKSKKSI